MRKCDFCPHCDSKGNCRWMSASARAFYCEEAIELMIKTLKAMGRG